MGDSWKTMASGGGRTLVLAAADGRGIPSGAPPNLRPRGRGPYGVRPGDRLSDVVDRRHEDPSHGRFPHERWLHTAQGLWHLGRGPDLFGNDGRLTAPVYPRLSR